MNVTLASGSPRRRILLEYLVDAFDVHSPNVDETFPPGPVPEAMEAVAAHKADAVDGDVVLAADTAVLLDGDVLGKPRNRADAASMFERFQNRGHDVITALAVRGPSGTRTAHVRSHVHWSVPDDVVQAYLDSNAWTDKAGGYGVQDALLAPHLRIDGPWSNVVGLPLARTAELLRDAGIECSDPPLEADLRAQNPF